MNDRRIPIFLVAIGLVHIALALWFASITPYRTSGFLSHAPIPDIGAPDERQHANYIQSILNGDGFPILDIERMKSDPDYRRERYEDHQPPLYYLSAAAWCKVIGVSDVSDPNSGFKLRALNALFGCATLTGVFFVAFWGFKRFDLACAAALFPALLPMNVALSGAISNDPLLFALIAWTMAFIARAMREGWTTKLALLAGAFTGMAVLTKTTGLALGPVLLVVLFIPQVQKPRFVQVAIALAAVLLVAGPWLIRNQRVYHDPLAAGVFEKAFTDNPHKSDMLKIPQIAEGNPEVNYWTNWVGWWTARSFIGTFGYMDIWLNETGRFGSTDGKPPNTLYRVSLAALALLAIGWVRSLRETWAKDARAVTIANATLLAVVLILFIRFNNQFFQGQARYLYPAIVPLSIGFGSGVVVWAKKKPVAGIAIAAVFLLGLDIYAGTRLPDEFAKRAGTAQISNGGSPSDVQ